MSRICVFIDLKVLLPWWQIALVALHFQICEQMRLCGQSNKRLHCFGENYPTILVKDAGLWNVTHVTHNVCNVKKVR